MNRLMLLRHAKSSWDEPEMDDHDRPLAPRGRKAASKMATWIATAKVRPDLIVCSSAARAVQTMKPVADALEGVPTAVEDGLYTFDAAELVPRIRELPASTTTVLLIGHNPALQDLTLRLAAEGQLLERVREKFPTAALAILELDRAWTEVEDGSATLVDFVTPQRLT